MHGGSQAVTAAEIRSSWKLVHGGSQAVRAAEVRSSWKLAHGGSQTVTAAEIFLRQSLERCLPSTAVS